MKPASSALAAHLDGEVTTLATCSRLQRQDGWVRGFTDHDQPLLIDGLTYVASTGFLPSAIKSGADLSVVILTLTASSTTTPSRLKT